MYYFVVGVSLNGAGNTPPLSTYLWVCPWRVLVTHLVSNTSWWYVASDTPPLSIYLWVCPWRVLVTHLPLYLLVGVSLEGAGDTLPSSPVPFKSKVINEQLLP